MNNSWSYAPVSTVTNIYLGGTPSRANPKYWGGDITWASAKDIASSDDRYIYDASETITQAGLDNSATKLLPKKTIVITARGTVGAIRMLGKPMAFNQTCYGLIPNIKMDSIFFFFFLKAGLDEIKSLSYGTVFDTITKKTFESLLVPTPPLQEQHAIANILGSLDDKIELNRRMNATLEEIAKALFKNLFVDNPEAKNWKAGKLGDDFYLIMGQSPPGDTYNEKGVGLPFFQGCTDFGFRFPTNRVYCSKPTRYAESGDTLVSVRAPVGDINMAMSKCSVGRGLASIRHKSFSSSYTYYVLCFIQNILRQFEAEGTVFGSINKKDFLNLKILIPPITLIKEFEGVSGPLDKKIENNENEIRTLIIIRDTLIPRLISGEIRTIYKNNEIF